jgi:hypothetical protein
MVTGELSSGHHFTCPHRLLNTCNWPAPHTGVGCMASVAPGSGLPGLPLRPPTGLCCNEQGLPPPGQAQPSHVTAEQQSREWQACRAAAWPAPAPACECAGSTVQEGGTSSASGWCVGRLNPLPEWEGTRPPASQHASSGRNASHRLPGTLHIRIDNAQVLITE